MGEPWVPPPRTPRPGSNGRAWVRSPLLFSAELGGENSGPCTSPSRPEADFAGREAKPRRPVHAREGGGPWGTMGSPTT